MSASKLCTIEFCLLMSCVLSVPTTVAVGQGNEGDVEVPGRVLSPGTYWFTLK